MDLRGAGALLHIAALAGLLWLALLFGLGVERLRHAQHLARGLVPLARAEGLELGAGDAPVAVAIDRDQLLLSAWSLESSSRER